MKLATIFEGWTMLDTVLAVWSFTGFVTFMIAGVFQIPETARRISEIEKTSGPSKRSWMAFGRFYITPSNSGIIGGTGFCMATFGLAEYVRTHRENVQNAEIGLTILYLMTAYALFHVCRAIWIRFHAGSE